jgi:hypothetical protein
MFDINNGLIETTEQDIDTFNVCMAQAVPLSSVFADNNNAVKVIEWDSEFERWLEHRAKLFDEDGGDNYLPWRIYERLGLKWKDGFAYQQRQGDCASMGHGNSLNASNLSNSIRSDNKPKEIARSMAYAIARGNGKPKFGDGLNLIPMSRWASEIGNYWTEDFGKYDGGLYCRNYLGGEQDKHALQTQSIIAYLPKPTFEYCYKATRARLGINIGSGTFPSASRVTESHGLATTSGWSNGGHSVALTAAVREQQLVFLHNSHGAKYAQDRLSDGQKQWGCWLSPADVAKMGTFNYGVWYVNIGELVGL